MLTCSLIFLPVLAALLFFVVPEASAKRVAFIASLAEFAVAIVAYITYKSDPSSASLSCKMPWIGAMNANWHVAIDGISMLMVLLTTLLVPFILLSSFAKNFANPKAFYALVLTMQAALIGVFTAMDGFLFYVFWELALIPIYFICLLWGGEGRAKITFKFFIYTLFGSLFMLAALIYLYIHADHSWNVQDLYAAGKSLNGSEQTWIFWALFLAFGIKMPIFPLHTWQPDTYTNAPTQGTMLLSGIMLKMGTYGLIRWLIPMVPVGMAWNSKYAIALSVISVVYASCIAIAQKDFKRMIAYSSIAHVGLISAGIMANNIEGVQGGLIQMMSHGINVVALFYIFDLLQSRMQTSEMRMMGGIRGVAPQFALLFLIVLLGSVAMPLTNGFVGEFLLLNGIFQHNIWMAAAAGLTVILGAVYMLRGYQTMMLGETNERTNTFTDLTNTEKWVLIPLAILIIVFGIYPKPLLDLTADHVQVLVNGVQAIGAK